MDFAIKAHADQKRDDGSPYISHLARVAYLGASYFPHTLMAKVQTLGRNLIITWSDAVAGLWLHDYIEDVWRGPNDPDQEGGFLFIEKKFSLPVGYIVRGLTNEAHNKEATTRGQRKGLDRKRLLTYPDIIQQMKMLDRLDNISDTAGFSEKFRRKYAVETRALALVLRKVDPMLANLIDAKAREILEEEPKK